MFHGDARASTMSAATPAPLSAGDLVGLLAERRACGTLDLVGERGRAWIEFRSGRVHSARVVFAVDPVDLGRRRPLSDRSQALDELSTWPLHAYCFLPAEPGALPGHAAVG